MSLLRIGLLFISPAVTYVASMEA